ncbi:MAG: DUF167 domain-containing protein [Dehalococcoidales bacterium]|nr:DUF167 domain-containing protein [Dehalococcoidales bacterium]
MSSIQTRISVQVRPGAPKNEVTAFAGGVWQIKVAAPPVEGRANRELVAFLSDRLGVAKSAISIVIGLTSRRKILVINGLSQAEITRRLMPERLMPEP